jgi:sugar-phosphatase
MDGLLLDSEILWHEAEVEIFSNLGVPISMVDQRTTKGIYVNDVVAHWYAQYAWSGPSVDEVVAILVNRVGELVREKGTLLPGAVRTLDLTSERGPIALASSTPLALIENAMDHFGLRERFVSLHSAQFEPYGKPHPGVFLSAAASLGVAPTDCLVFEDSPAGVLAGKAGRMTVVAVPTPEDAPHPAYGLADLVLSNLNELTTEWLDERFS